MSVNKDKTLARIRTFAQDFDTEKPDNASAPISVATQSVPQEHPREKADTSDHVAKPATGPSIVVTAKEEPTPGPHKLSAFHELEKTKRTTTTTSTETTTAPEQASKPIIKIGHIQSKHANRPNMDLASTVITDTKRERGGIFKRITTSLYDWFTTVTAKKQKASSAYSVPKADRRRGVVQKATTKSGAIFTASNEQLKEEIRKRKLKEEHEQNITWTPNTESVFPLLAEESSKPAIDITALEAPVLVDSVNRWEFTGPDEAVDEPVSEVPLAQPAPLPVPEPMPGRIPEPPMVSSIPEKPLQPPELVVIASAPSTTPSVTPILAQEKEMPVSIPKPKTPRFFLPKIDISKLNTNGLAVGSVTIVFGVIVLVFIIQNLFSFVFSGTNTSTVSQATPLLFNTVIIDVVVPDFTAVALDTALKNVTINPTTVTEVRLVDGAKQPLSPNQLIGLLAFSTNPNFNQSITDLHLLFIDQIERGLVLKVTDKTTALGGLLFWEQKMVTDLDPILNLAPVPTSFKFSDKVISGTDVRVLTVSGNEIVVYGFVDDRTVIIARDLATFNLLINNYR